jgi:hypothetical protein
MTIDIAGPWCRQQVDDFLSQSRIPVQLVCLSADGFPRKSSLWFHYRGGRLHCVSHRSARLVALLQRQPGVGFEVASSEPPYRGVAGQGTASLQALGQDPMLKRLLLRYLGELDSALATWLLSRSDEEVLITVELQRLSSWDCQERMATAV